VVDVAVFIEGKTFRQAREAWIDNLLVDPTNKSDSATSPAAPPPRNKSTASEGTESGDKASNANAELEDGEDATVEDANGDEAGDTKAANETIEGNSADVKDGATKDDEAETNAPGVTTQSRQMPLMRERLANYLAASGAKVERDEIGWLIAEWGSGPGLIVLDVALSWQRAGVATLEALLDGDSDGMLSVKEISEAEDMLSRADLDANGVVEVSEIHRTNRREPRIPFKMSNSLVVVLDANTDWDALATILASVYAQPTNETPTANSTAPTKDRIAHGGATLTADSLRGLVDEFADISLRVDFGRKEDAAAGVSLVATSPDLTTERSAVTASENVITVDLGADYLEISAAGVSSEANSTSSEPQVAVGAVIDGNPLLRVLDQDQDQRLTLRERHELTGLLKSLDGDADGKLAAAEMPIPIRLAITLGPQVHNLLAEPAGAARAIASTSESAPPDWFASMDKNNDRDLSREEFLGTTKQFKQADADGDGLLNVTEALVLDGGK
jgi:hypothetical protein